MAVAASARLRSARPARRRPVGAVSRWGTGTGPPQPVPARVPGPPARECVWLMACSPSGCAVGRRGGVPGPPVGPRGCVCLFGGLPCPVAPASRRRSRCNRNLRHARAAAPQRPGAGVGNRGPARTTTVRKGPRTTPLRCRVSVRSGATRTARGGSLRFGRENKTGPAEQGTGGPGGLGGPGFPGRGGNVSSVCTVSAPSRLLYARSGVSAGRPKVGPPGPPGPPSTLPRY